VWLVRERLEDEQALPRRAQAGLGKA